MPTAWFTRQRATADARTRKGGPGYGEKQDKAKFDKIRRAEYQYSIRLRRLARECGNIVKAFPIGTPESAAQIRKVLTDYSKALTPWATATANVMLAEVSRKDEQYWAQMTKGMGAALRQELASAPTGIVLRQMQAEQIKYITKIPLDAAERVHELTMEGILGAKRADEVAAEIRRTSDVSEAYANLVARTEVGRVATNLTVARATYIGSEGYIWRTADDSDVRPSHRALEGTYHRWDSPPLCDKPNYHAHPGAIFNCRCYPEVVLPKQYN